MRVVNEEFQNQNILNYITLFRFVWVVKEIS